ncbi:MAG TPA: DUF333 domain-containing protein [Xanthobacteraceae bacterium]
MAIERALTILASSVCFCTQVLLASAQDWPTRPVRIVSGGKSEIRKGPRGEYGVCRLPDGRVVEEWTYFRKMKGR